MSKSKPLTPAEKRAIKQARKNRKNGRGKQWQQIAA